MSEAKHTPGPWRIGSKCEERGRTWIGGSSENGVSVLPYLACINWPDHQDANARLIAAAPDMLELLIELVDIEGPMPGTSEWGDKARALIAKATGGAA